MLILTLRTDKPESELGLYDDRQQIGYEVWQAHRQLAETVHSKLQEVLEGNGKELDDIQGLVVYKGPGSFTGLRIGLSVANALAHGLGVPIVGRAGEEAWLEKGLDEIISGKNDKAVMPEYGAPVHITTPKK